MLQKNYQGNGEELEDLISIGTIGLIKAISTFNSERSARLSTYAARCIDNELLMMLRARKKVFTWSFSLWTDRNRQRGKWDQYCWILSKVRRWISVEEYSTRHGYTISFFFYEGYPDTKRIPGHLLSLWTVWKHRNDTAWNRRSASYQSFLCHPEIEKTTIKKLKTLFGWFSVRNNLKLETDWDVFSRKEVFFSYDRYNWTIRLCIYAQTIETTADSSALYCFDRNRFCTRFGLCSLTACNDQQL